MNWTKIKTYFGFLVFGLVFFGIISVLMLAIIGGVQTGELTWIGLPIWLWSSSGGLIYFFLGCFTAGGTLSTILNIPTKESIDSTNTNREIAGLLIIIFSGFLWPVVWGAVVYNWLVNSEE